MNPVSERLLRRVIAAADSADAARSPRFAVDWCPEASDGPWNTWTRYASVSTAAASWPAPGPPVAVAAVRQNRAREATELAVRVANARLAPGGTLLLFGENDDGIRSVRTVAGLSFESIDLAGHGRVLAAHALAAPTPTLTVFRRDGRMRLPTAGERPWVSYPGSFARGTLDAGTAALLSTLGTCAPPRRVLDFACGTGVVAAEVAARWPHAEVVGVDADAIALEAARHNVPTAAFRLGTSLAATGGERFDLILSNPPFHQGRRRDDSVWRGLVTAAKAFLADTGELRIVVQREVQPERALAAAFGQSTTLATSPGHRVWSAR